MQFEALTVSADFMNTQHMFCFCWGFFLFYLNWRPPHRNAYLFCRRVWKINRDNGHVERLWREPCFHYRAIDCLVHFIRSGEWATVISSAAGWPIVLMRTAMMVFSLITRVRSRHPAPPDPSDTGEISPKSQTINKSRQLDFISFQGYPKSNAQ